MSKLDSKAPKELLSLQQWFASILTRPIDVNSEMSPLSPSGYLMSEEAPRYILPSRTLSSEKRIQIYNQQYWWRLLSTLHQNFPGLTALFGYTDFNLSIGIPFLTKNPSTHWSLAILGEELPLWIEENYNGDDKVLVFSMAKIDLGYQQLFYAPQPAIKLYRFPFDFFSLRLALLKEPVEHWEKSMEFPKVSKEGNYFFTLFRTLENHLVYKEVNERQWTLMKEGL